MKTYLTLLMFIWHQVGIFRCPFLSRIPFMSHHMKIMFLINDLRTDIVHNLHFKLQNPAIWNETSISIRTNIFNGYTCTPRWHESTEHGIVSFNWLILDRAKSQTVAAEKPIKVNDSNGNVHSNFTWWAKDARCEIRTNNTHKMDMINRKRKRFSLLPMCK